jgi:predicted alpha/beta hydrolase
MPTSTLTLTADDGYVLTGSHHAPTGDIAGQPDRFLLIAGATGVPRGFYRRFAEYAAGEGYHVVSVDFRGLGDSRQGPLKGFDMAYVDWSRRDLAAAASWALARGPTAIVGHSLGGHALGLLPQHQQITAAYICGGGAGWHGWMPAPERYRVWLLWNAIGPLATRVLGYMPMRMLGGGEDLPLGVYRDWRRWCSFPRYFFDDPTAAHLTAEFPKVTMPIAAAVAHDDLWATPASRDAFFQHYTGASVDRVDLSPAELGVAHVGHMGYFRPPVGQVLWPRIISWLKARAH